MTPSQRTLKLRVKRDAYPWLNAAAVEVNRMWNWCAEYSRSRMRNGLAAPSGYDLSYAMAGFTVGFKYLTADTLNEIGAQYATKRRLARTQKLRWRVSAGSRCSLG